MGTKREKDRICVCCDGGADCRQRDSSVLFCQDDDAIIYSVDQGSVPVTELSMKLLFCLPKSEHHHWLLGLS